MSSKHAKSNTTSQDQRQKLARKLSIVGGETRLNILCLLFSHEDHCVSQVAKLAGVSVSNASYHLNTLADAELCDRYRHQRTVCYVPRESQLMDMLKHLVCTPF